MSRGVQLNLPVAGSATSRPKNAVPRPPVKWAGGKSRLLPDLLDREPSGFAAYHEPFVGGGGLFFELRRLGKLKGSQGLISDLNDELINAYIVIRANLADLQRLLRHHARMHSKEHYLAVRASRPTDPVERAARFIYLLKTCFNGLYRVNSRGEFNVPFGDNKNPTICDEANLRAVADALAGTAIETRDFGTVLEGAQPGDWVYFDPPYDSPSTAPSFTQYTAAGFGRSEQRRLAATFRALDRKGVSVLLSNADTGTVRGLYSGFKIEVVRVARSINSKVERRGTVSELLIRNYEVDLDRGSLVRDPSA